MVSFVDQVVLHLRAGNGGDGCVSVHREKFKPLAGPDGADGGNGGSISLIADSSVTTLLDYHFHPHRSGGDGGDGAGDFRNGATGPDIKLPVPIGTVVKNAKGEFIADLLEPGMELVVAEGGMGGLRVEVRGMKSGARLVDVIAVVERVGQVAGVVAATTAHAIYSNKLEELGAHVLGDKSMPNSWLVTQICSAGINLHSFVRA